MRAIHSSYSLLSRSPADPFISNGLPPPGMKRILDLSLRLPLSQRVKGPLPEGNLLRSPLRGQHTITSGHVPFAQNESMYIVLRTC